MCVAIYKPKKSNIPKKVLEACFRQNDDGAGFAAVAEVGGKNVVLVEKGFFTFDSFWKAWREFGDPYQAILHFRVMTHGKIAPENCHPFLVTAGDRQLAVAHNGVLYDFTRYASNARSDSRAYVETAIGPLFTKFPKLLKNGPLMDLIERGTGMNNKVAMLENDGTVYLVNKSAWYESEFDAGVPKVWFSNQHWKSSMDNRGTNRSIGPTCPTGNNAPNYAAYLEGADLNDAWDGYGADGMRWSASGAAASAPTTKPEERPELKNDPATQKLLLPAPVRLPEPKKTVEARDGGRIMTAIGNDGPFKLVVNPPKHVQQREVDRRGSERLFWEDGYIDAYEGVPYSPASASMPYCEGFTDAISEMEGNDDTDGSFAFISGYNDRLTGNEPTTKFETLKKQKQYRAGLEWADYYRINNAEEARRDDARADNAGTGDGSTGVLNGAAGGGEVPDVVPGLGGNGEAVGNAATPRAGSLLEIAAKAALLRN